MARTSALLGGANIFTAYLFLSTAWGQTPSPSPSPTPSASASASFSNGAGIAVAVIVAIVIIGILCCCFCCPQARRSFLGACGRSSRPPAPPATAYFPLSSGAVPPWLPLSPDTAVRWILAHGPPPADVVPFTFGVGEGGEPEFFARTRLGDGSLRPGRVARGAQFAQGCRVACEWSPGSAESHLALGHPPHPLCRPAS